jgi:thioredoxin reductase
MKLRSTWYDSGFASPDDEGATSAWAAATGRDLLDPPSLPEFIEYGDWFLDTFVEDHDVDNVASVERIDSRFLVTTTGGSETVASVVVVAVGVTPFGQVPDTFVPLRDDPALSFATEYTDHQRFAGKRVVILGGGQGGLEAALWCTRANANVEILVRSTIKWFGDHEPWSPRGPLRRRLHALAYPVHGFGPPLLNRLAVRPELFARLPVGPRMRLTRRILRAGGSPWLREEVEANAKITDGVSVLRARRSGEAIELELSDGSRRQADHVFLGTGFAFDPARLQFLAPDLAEGIALEAGWPRLDRNFQSSVAGLYFVGFAAEARFGPTARFVRGARHAAPTAAAAIRERSKGIRAKAR